ncbi:MAG: lactonase family protein [Calditrichaeota bacterium]|nr:lactonase family protein [Calditrichota bacterium]
MLSAGQNSTSNIYIGTYTQNSGQGIYVYSFNNQTGELALKHVVKGVENPSYLTLSSDNRYLYAVNENMEYNGKPGGAVSSFQINPQDGNLKFLNIVPSQGQAPCYISLSSDNKFALVNNYVGATVASFPITKNGSLQEAVSVITHEGSGPNKKRQDAPHMHSIRLEKENDFAYAADLGSDKLYTYQFDKSSGNLTHLKDKDFSLTPGSGARHFEINYKNDCIYVITELANTIEVFGKSSGERIQTISTLPDSFSGQSYCADIHVHPAGKFLYVSNRGHNSIALFYLNPENGELSFKATFSVHGNWPRNFVIDPNGKFLLVANQKSNNISVFRIDPDNGQLEFVSSVETDASPVCLKFSE